MWKTALKSILIAISYYSLKKVIERLPAAYQPYATFVLRAALFFTLFLSIFAFLSGRVSAIDENTQVVSKLIINLLLGFSLLVTILLSFLLTAFFEEVYRKISTIHQKAEDGIKKATQTPGRIVRQSVETTKNLFSKAAEALGAAAGSLYDTSTKVTGSSVDKAEELIQKVIKKKEEGGKS